MALRIIIADDEDLMRRHLRLVLAEIDDPEIEIVGEASDGREAVDLTLKHRPDVLLLDIQMPMLDGFEVLNALMLEDFVPEIVFTTAYDEYAIRAFDVNAVAYLLKPIARDKLQTACLQAAKRVEERAGKVREADGAAETASAGEPWQELLNEIRGRSSEAGASEPPLLGLACKHRDQLEVVRIDSILHVSAEEGLNFVFTETGKFLTDFTLDQLEKRLARSDFLRIHRSHLVNLRRIRALVPWFEGKFKVILDDPARTELSLSRYRLAAVRKRILW